MATIDINTAGAIELTRKGDAYASAYAGRQHVETEIERLINMLDEWDSDPDLEPMLGAPETDSMTTAWCRDHEGRLRFAPGGDQSRWSAGGGAMAEEDVDEEGGDILDEPHDGALDQLEGEDWEDLEYSLGWPLQDGQHPALFASANASGDLEATNEDGGDVLDEPHDANTSEDCELDEPTLFSPNGAYLAGGGSRV